MGRLSITLELLQGDDDQPTNEPMKDYIPKWKLILNNTKSLISSIAIDEKTGNLVNDDAGDMQQRCFQAGEDDEASHL